MTRTVSDDDMRAYLATYHDVYRQTIEDLVPEDVRARLLRFPLIGNDTVAYISTISGAGFEYTTAAGGEVSIRKGSRPVEDLLFNPPPAFRSSASGPSVFISEGTRIFAIGSRFTDIIPLRLRGGDFTFVGVTAKGGSWHREIAYAELRADQRAENWTEALALERVKDELLVAFNDVLQSEKRQATLDAILKKAKANYVLLLGDFKDEGRKRIDAIRGALPDHYWPFTLDELQDRVEENLIHKVTLLAGISRIVIADDSSRSGQLAELGAIVASSRAIGAVLIVLRLEGSDTSNVTKGISAGSSGDVQEYAYTPETLNTVLTSAIAAAETWIAATGDQLGNTYPWRQTS